MQRDRKIRSSSIEDDTFYSRPVSFRLHREGTVPWPFIQDWLPDIRRFVEDSSAMADDVTSHYIVI